MTTTHDNEFPVYAALGVGFGIYSFFGGFRALHKKRMIENIPTSTIRAMAMGLVEITGTVESVTLLTSPLTETTCAYYQYDIAEWHQSRRSGHWETIASGDSRAVPFRVNDTTGTVLVVPRGADLVMKADFQFETRWGRPAPANIIAFMTARNIRHTTLFGSKTMRFREWYFRPGDMIYIMGTAKKADERSLTIKDEARRRIAALKADPARMKALDANADGTISVEEWDAAVARIEQETLEHLLSSPDTTAPDVVIGTGETEPLFVLSDRSEKELVSALTFRAVLGIVGGALLTIVAAGFLLVYVNVIQL